MPRSRTSSSPRGGFSFHGRGGHISERSRVTDPTTVQSAGVNADVTPSSVQDMEISTVMVPTITRDIGSLNKHNPGPSSKPALSSKEKQKIPCQTPLHLLFSGPMMVKLLVPT